MVNGLLQPGITVSRSTLTRIVIGAAVAVVCCATAVEAQRDRGLELVSGLTILGGPHQRTGFVGTLRYHRHSPNGLTVVPQITAIHSTSLVFRRTTFGIAEVFAAQEITQRRLRPVVGGGAGSSSAAAGWSGRPSMPWKDSSSISIGAGRCSSNFGSALSRSRRPPSRSASERRRGCSRRPPARSSSKPHRLP